VRALLFNPQSEIRNDEDPHPDPLPEYLSRATTWVTGVEGT
jgi:hypothetical protein